MKEWLAASTLTMEIIDRMPLGALWARFHLHSALERFLKRLDAGKRLTCGRRVGSRESPYMISLYKLEVLTSYDEFPSGLELLAICKQRSKSF